jgi:hypothetical protein
MPSTPAARTPEGTAGRMTAGRAGVVRSGTVGRDGHRAVTRPGSEGRAVTEGDLNVPGGRSVLEGRAVMIVAMTGAGVRSDASRCSRCRT